MGCKCYFCPNDSSTGTSLDPKPCPEGHYCPLGSAAAAQCPAGTLSSSRSVSSAEECDLCPRGSYCTEPGALAVTGACDAGFLCIAGATDPRPTDGVTGSPCPAGGYCVAGTVIVKPCPPGTYNPDEGAENEDACQPCPAGSFCLGSGSSKPDGKCRPGHYCPEQSSRATQRKASIGHFAAAGASEETACEVGYYAPEEGMDKCIACPAGQVCPREGMAAPEECPQGWYCPEAVAAALKCVAGTYGDRPGLREWNECKLCPPGHFCEGEGLLDKSGLCDAGYYCVQSATSARPEIVSTGRSLAGEVSGPCPAGHFCPQGSITPTPCPKGMFSSTLKAVSEATCQQCTEGFYCDRPGLAAPTGPCPEGYFCPRGSVVDRDPTHLCPRGHYCPQQAVEALPCSAGTYAEVDGSAACTPCPGGFLCAASAQQFLQACSAGHYCPTGNENETDEPAPETETPPPQT
uniref:GCC2 and GCC3 domain-containing protein n=1 Tax=Toxoplasma gondii TgCATBr9 TaxID=943120 RepID=A0A2T6ISN8_TOXGO|nr:GCC2 and GCC3 domain-containing protein [Toxoplasma gondii TgCATBr9]